MTAQTAEESRLRIQQWILNGCNGFNMKSPISNPMSFWVEQDILQYIKQNNLKIASVYGEVVYGQRDSDEQYNNLLCECGQKLCTTGCDRTGCIFCGFGAHLEKGESRFQRLKRTHPRQYEYCLEGGAYQWECEIQTVDGKWREYSFLTAQGKRWDDKHIERFVETHKNDKNYRFRRLWEPTKEGLGMKHVFDEVNKIYGKDFIKY